MKKFFAFLLIALLCWGFASAQVPDNPPVVCELPSVLDSLRGETPECPTLGVPSVALDGTGDRVEFSVPVTGGASFDGVSGHFAVTVDGVGDIFLVEGTFNPGHTLLEGSVMVNGDNAMAGLDLRGHTLYVTAGLTGCHAAGALDPTSPEGVVSQTVTYGLLPACTSFDSLVVYAAAGQYQLRAYIDLSTLQPQNPLFNIVATAGQYAGGTAWYVDASQQFLATPMTALPTQQTVLQVSASVDARCGVETVNNGYVTINSASVTVTVPMAIPCPTLGNVSLVSNQATNPDLRADTLFVQVGNYNADLIHQVVFDVTRIGSSTTLEWVAEGWSAARGAAYKVLTLALLQQLGLTTTDVVATVDATLEVNANYSGCTNVSISGKVITLTALPECPAFAGYAVTTVSQDYDGNITVTTPLVHYNPLMIYHTGVSGQDSLFYTLYINNSGTAQQGVESGTIEAVYDVQSMMMTCSIPYHQVVPGARYDFVPHLHLTSYCNGTSGPYATIDGPAGTIVSAVYCPAYTATTDAVRNADGSVTVTHQLLNYSPSLLHPTASPRAYGYDSLGIQRMYSTDVQISADGFMTCTFPASNFDAYPSHNMRFRFRVYLATDHCAQLPNGPLSNYICIPYSSLPSFGGVSNSSGESKVALFKNEGVTLMTQIVDYSSFSNRIARKGFLISRSPITEYSADKAVLGTMGGAAGDSLYYKVAMDSCGGVIYYRPFLVMRGCDSSVVLGAQNFFMMWAPDLTVTATPDHVASGGSVTLDAVATMNVGAWTENTSNGVPCNMIGYFTNSCNLTYTEDCTTTKNMEVWMYLLIGLRNCPSFWDNFSGMITNALGMDPGIADFQYRWERNGTTFFSTPSPSDAGLTTDTPTATTVYTGVADFTYNGVHCIQKRNVTVSVP